MIAAQLQEKIQDKSAKVGIYGLGYVGLPLAYYFSEAGYTVTGFDVDQTKIDKLNSGESVIKHIPDESVVKMNAVGFQATDDFSQSKEMDILILCIPTPLNEYREPDLSYIEKTMLSIIPHMREGQLLSLESTTYPGTTDEVLAQQIKAKGFNIGEDYFLVYSPEREDPGNKHYTTKTIPKVLGGYTQTCAKLGKEIYQRVIDEIVVVSSTRAAELTKLLENIHRSVNIGLVNEMKVLAEKMDINIHEVIDAAATKPFGFVPYYPGPGIGGHCIPVDPFYLTWKAREYGMHTRFIELSGEINNAMPGWVVTKTMEGLNRQKKSLNGSKVIVLGVSYKPDIDDLRESPSLEILKLLIDAEADVSYSDPYWPSIPKTRKHDFSRLENKALTKETLEDADAVILATHHSDFNYDLIRDHARLVIDTRGKYHKEDLLHIIQA